MAPGSRRGLVACAVAVLCGAALWWPEADPEALRAQGVAHLLREDAERARRGEGGLLAGLAALEAPAGLALTVRRGDGSEASPRVERAVATALRDAAERPPSGARLPTWVEPGTPGAGRLGIEVHQAGSRLELTARWEASGERTSLPSAGRWLVPGPSALLPPLVAIGVALVWRRTLLALFLGIWAGASAAAWRDGAGPLAPLRGLGDVFGVYFARELTDSFRFEIIGFVVALLAMVGVMSRAGGVQGLVDRALALGRSARSAQVLTWASGLVVFFDDYANSMLVGSTLRPLTDRLRVSREKLAYLVDSTAAPVAGLSLLSTWIAFQVSVFAPQLPAAGIETSGYAVFVESLPYRFYCWLALGFALAVAVSGRDFGPMRRAEARARHTGELVRPGARPPLSDALARMQPAEGMAPAARRAALPLLTTLLVTAWRIFADGGGPALLAAAGPAGPGLEDWTRVLLEGSGAGPIFGGALAGLGCAVFLAGGPGTRAGIAGGALAAGAGHYGAGLGWGAALLLLAAPVGALAAWRAARAPAAGAPQLGPGEILRAACASGSTLGFAVVLLFEAWMIGAVCAELATADYLVALLDDALSPGWLPLLLFVGAGLVSFSTGSSWSTMSILLPNAVPLAAVLGAQTEFGAAPMVVFAIGAVLDGAIFGDHCSPISDTTVLSAVASGCDHLDHVRTQLPYALLVATVAVLAGHLPLLLGAGWGPGAGLALGALAAVGALFALGRPTPPAPGPAA